MMSRVSPHTRGWTLDSPPRGPLSDGFPAHAGMDLLRSRRATRPTGFPRTRGDGPPDTMLVIAKTAVSPHTRGWTDHTGDGDDAVQGFPAHAGMDPSRTTRAASWARFPRTRGDGPLSRCGFSRPTMLSPHTRGWTARGVAEGAEEAGFPAHAGMDRRLAGRLRLDMRFPRTRGDGPRAGCGTARTCSVSPHTRGWTPPCPTYMTIEPLAKS